MLYSTVLCSTCIMVFITAEKGHQLLRWLWPFPILGTVWHTSSAVLKCCTVMNINPKQRCPEVKCYLGPTTSTEFATGSHTLLMSLSPVLHSQPRTDINLECCLATPQCRSAACAALRRGTATEQSLGSSRGPQGRACLRSGSAGLCAPRTRSPHSGGTRSRAPAGAQGSARRGEMSADGEQCYSRPVLMPRFEQLQAHAYSDRRTHAKTLTVTKKHRDKHELTSVL